MLHLRGDISYNWILFLPDPSLRPVTGEMEAAETGRTPRTDSATDPLTTPILLILSQDELLHVLNYFVFHRPLPLRTTDVRGQSSQQ